MNAAVFREVIDRSLDNTLSFPEVVQRLMQEGGESYHVDFVRRENRYYLPDGQNHVEAVGLRHPEAAQEFSAAQVDASVRAIQAGSIDYPTFVDRILKAGCVYYSVYLGGRQVLYFGRDGSFHREPFPGTK